MWVYTYNDELYHHGVKGMKWGKRKARSDGESGSSRSSPTVKKSRSTASNSTNKTKSKPVTKKKVDKGREECKKMLEAFEAEEKARKIKTVSNLAGSMLARHGYDGASSVLSGIGDMTASRLSFGAGYTFWNS